MSDPKRLLEDSTAESGVALLLQALRPAEPPSAAKEAELVQRMLTPIAAPLPHAGGAGKVPWLIAGGALLVAGLVTWLISRHSAAPVVVAPAATAALVVAAPPPPQLPEAAPGAEVAAANPPAPPASVASSKPNPRDTLAEEEALLEQARRLLATSPAGALALLRQHQQRFPAGQLTAERLFLSVDALRRSGNTVGAERQAQVLLKRFPSSVYAGQLRAAPLQKN